MFIVCLKVGDFFSTKTNSVMLNLPRTEVSVVSRSFFNSVELQHN